MAHSKHTIKAFDSDLDELARAIAEMGGMAERQIAEATAALTTRDGDRARRMITADATIDAMQRNIEERAVETIARRQPVAGDLRQIIGVLRIANEIERIGDLAKNIGKRIIAINGEEMPPRSMRGVNHMATLMLTQLRDVLDSFARRDVAKALDVWTRDQDIDRLCTSLSQELLADMMEQSVAMCFGAHLMFCTKNLERIGDHATNIAEAVHYMVKGETPLRERPKADFASMLTVAMGRKLGLRLKQYRRSELAPLLWTARNYPRMGGALFSRRIGLLGSPNSPLATAAFPDSWLRFGHGDVLTL